MVKGDASDTDSLIAAFKGATAIFGLTDFWTPAWDPSSYGKLKSGQTINEYCFDLEVQQGKNIADAAAKTAGLQRYIYSSLPDTSKVKGNYKNLYHIYTKTEIMKYLRKTHPDLAKITSEIQLSIYYEIWYWKLLTSPQKVRFPQSNQ